MEIFSFNAKKINSDKLLNETAIYKDDYSDRRGYDSKFLNKEIPLPTIDTDLQGDIAKNNSPNINGENYIDYSHFSVAFNKEKKLPFFTAVNIVGNSNEIATIHDKRSADKWFIDNRIKIGEDLFQFNDDDYAKSGFQRGHMVRFYDPAWGENKKERKIAMGDTFHYTNCCPQVGKYNAGVWNDLEDYYMARSIFKDDKVTVFTGPIFNKAKKINGLLVPLNFWKVIVYNSAEGVEALAFLISQEIAMKDVLERVMELEQFVVEAKKVKPTLKKEDIDKLFNEKNLKKWMVKIELIEEKTGINFGLNHVDVNKGKEKLFYEQANHIKASLPISRFDKFITKESSPAELVSKSQIKNHITEYDTFLIEQTKIDVIADLEIIKNI